jgi:very-short-patch-repair endonuclease
LAESGLNLRSSLRDLLDLSGEEPSLQPIEEVQVLLESKPIRIKSKNRAKAVLRSIEPELTSAGWNFEEWIDNVINQIPLQFEQACSRWKELFRTAKWQQKVQQKIIDDMSREKKDRDNAKRLRSEAESQIELLTENKNIMQSDFYSYRYFASEGFLPGYSFPRLPLSAYIPGRRIKGNKDEFLSRPRFLAISEFGPQSIIYHEGSRYVINRVSLAVSENGEDIANARAKQCGVCGYYHPITQGDGVDRCEYCHAMLQETLTSLFQLQNVSTKRRDRITSDEEERMRQGFELRTGIRFSQTHAGTPNVNSAEVLHEKSLLAELTYASSADIWRINLGWKRRANQDQKGFMLDLEKGYWAKQTDDDDDETNDPLGSLKKMVIPYVRDTKNCLLFKPGIYLEEEQMASLQAALKAAIQIQYQLEDNELAAELLPDRYTPKLILFYEAAEGGAGVLRQLLEDPSALNAVARQALKLCHFNPESGEDLRHSPGAKEDCEAACYDCLMSYYNQMDHRLLDRQTIKSYLMELKESTVSIAPKAITRSEYLKQLKNLCQSDLEIEWLDLLEKNNLNLPSHAQKLMDNCKTRPDFLYESQKVAIYVDGPHHQYPGRQERDTQQQECLNDYGYIVLRFGLIDDWLKIFTKYHSIFGKQN